MGQTEPVALPLVVEEERYSSSTTSGNAADGEACTTITNIFEANIT